MSVAVNSEDLDTLLKQDIDSLYSDLALTDAGTAGQAGFSAESLKSLKGVMLAEGAAVDSIGDWLRNRGVIIFNKVWPSVKAVVCAAYKQNGEDGDLKDWVKTVATLILGVFSIAAAAAVVVAVIAIKLGLDALCASGASEQPAG